MKLNMDNAINVSYFFFARHSLIILPDINKWNINIILNLYLKFFDCLFISSIHDMNRVSNDNNNNLK